MPREQIQRGGKSQKKEKLSEQQKIQKERKKNLQSTDDSIGQKPGKFGIKEDMRSDSLFADYFKINQYFRCQTRKCLVNNVNMKS